MNFISVMLRHYKCHNNNNNNEGNNRCKPIPSNFRNLGKFDFQPRETSSCETGFWTARPPPPSSEIRFHLCLFNLNFQYITANNFDF